MNVVESQLKQRLEQTFQIAHLAIDNESHMHNVPANSETHFKVLLVTEDFEGLNKVKRHQALYGLFSDLMQNPIHALAMHLFTPEEWQGQNPDSPNCLGGGKK